MTYHREYCVCFLAFCAFGSIAASASLCLFLNYEVYEGNSTTTRTLPESDWTKTAAAIGAVGMVMGISGIFFIVFCLIAGVSEKKNTIEKYEAFHNENKEGVGEKPGASNTGAISSAHCPTDDVFDAAFGFW